MGLGVAGLRTAMLLEEAGVEVSMFEARGRVGGRLYTIDEGRGVLYEAGGEWIDADHHRVLALLKHFGLEPLPRASWPGKVIHKGKEATEALLWNDALEDDLRVEAAARELCRNLEEPPWKNQHVRELDERTLEQFFREHTQSERGFWWVSAKYRSDEGDDPDRIGLLGWLTGYLHYLDRDGDVMSSYRVPGGFGSLCDRMLKGLKGESHFGKVLTRVRQDEGGVSLVFEGGEVRVDRVVLTLPPPALERIVFEPAIGVRKRCAIEACRMSRAIKICWQFKEAWWRDQGWGGAMSCDGPLQQTWDGSLGEAPVLSAYMCGKVAADWVQLGDPVRAGIYELSRLFPDAPRHFVRGWVHDWLNDPYAQGGFSHQPPGYVLEHMEHIAPPEGRVHFAGEHTALVTGFIEGAIESAERVTPEVLHEAPV